MSSAAVPRDTRRAILDAARSVFEEQGYFGGALEAVAKKAGVSRQAIYLHFDSKATLLSALHAHVYETDVRPAVDRHNLTGAATSMEALEAGIAADAEVVEKVWKIHEALVLARRHHPEVDETLRPRERERYNELLRVARWLKRDGLLRAGVTAKTFADVLWGLTSLGTYQNLVLERGWSMPRWTHWVLDTIGRYLAEDAAASR